MIIGNPLNCDNISKNFVHNQSNNVKNSLNDLNKNNFLIFFTKLEKLLEEAKELNHLFYVARDKQITEKKGGTQWIKEFYSFPTANDYLQLLPLLPKDSRNWSELIVTDQQVKPVFDIEWYEFPNSEQHLDPEEGVMLLCCKIQEAFELLFRQKLELDDFRILESHLYDTTVTKYSFHLIIHPYRLKNLHQYGKVLAQRVISLIKKELDNPLNNCMDRQGKRKIPIDLEIYTRNRGMRMKDHFKQDQLSRPFKVPVLCEDNYPDIEYLLTETETKGKLVECQLPKEQEHMMTNTNTDNSNEFIQKCLDSINVENLRRSDWIKIGMGIYTVFGTDGLELYRAFSKKSEHYNEKTFFEAWNSLPPDNKVGGGTIAHYAKETNPKQYDLLLLEQRTEKEKLLNKALTLTHQHVGIYVASFLDNRLLCCDGYNKSQKLWYYFFNHRWHEYDGSIAIGNIIEYKVLPSLNKKSSHLFEQLVEISDKELAKKYEERVGKIEKLTSKLENVSFINHVVTVCRRKCYRPEVYDQFDENHDLLCCSNGVYDLKNGFFRDGKPEDLLTISSKIDYLEGDIDRPFGPDHPHVKAIEHFFSQIQPDAELRRYLQILLGSCLFGRNVKEQAYIFEGCGSNGKSKLLELLDKTLGEYYGSIAMSFFTGKKASSGQANPEIEAIAKTRILSASETDKGERFNIDILKKLTGNDKITYRGLNRPIKQTIAPFTILFAVNHLPKLPEDDKAVWRRVRVIRFKSEFVDNPDPENPFQFKKDEHFSEKLCQWRHAFLWLLIKWHKEFRKNGLPDIPQVLAATQEYQSSQDPIKIWLSNNLEVNGDKDDYVSVKELKDALMEEGIYRSKFKLDRDFVEFLTKMYKDCEYVKGQVKIKGYKTINVIRGIKRTEKDELDYIGSDVL